MSKQGETAVERITNLLHERVLAGNIARWINMLEWVNQMYSPMRNELQSVLALFAGTFNRNDPVEVAATVKIAKGELRKIVRRIKHANGIK